VVGGGAGLAAAGAVRRKSRSGWVVDSLSL
jgi:DNA-binding GntR family transcriptional regulator